jgi:type III pantothenate kinase
MNLIIDIGNTSIKLAVFDTQNTLKVFQRTGHNKIFEDLAQILQKYPANYAMISQVGQSVTGLEDFLQKRNINFWYLNTRLKLPFEVAYKTPDSIGADRLGLVAGAIRRTPNQNQLIIDAGSCVTYDFVDKNNVYHGGAISPGLPLRFKSLHDYTAKLPLLKPTEELVKLIGDDTKSSIESGVINGLIAEIEGISVKYNLKFKDLTVYLTGGDEKLLDRYIKNKIFVSSKFLLLEGINFILNLNK